MHVRRRRRTQTLNASVPKSRSQLSRILSNTGLGSAIEPLITFSTSAVAVCCSSASLVSLNSRAFCSATPTLAGERREQTLVVGGVQPSWLALWTLIKPMPVPPTVIGTPRYESAGRPTTLAPSWSPRRWPRCR